MPQDTASRRSSKYPPDRSRQASRGRTSEGANRFAPTNTRTGESYDSAPQYTSQPRQVSRGRASEGASRFAPTSTRTGESYDSAPQYRSEPTTGMRPRMVAQTTGHTPSYPPMSSFAPGSSAYPVQPSGNVASSQGIYRRPGGSYTPTFEYMPRRYSVQATETRGGPGSYAPQAIPSQAYEAAVRMPGSQPITVPSRLAGETPGRSQDSRGLPRPPTPGAPKRQGRRRSLTPGAPLASRGGVDTRGTTTPTGSYDRRRSGPTAESGSDKSRSKLVICNGAATLTLSPGETFSTAGGKTIYFSRNGINYLTTTEDGETTWSEIPERDERAMGTQLPAPPTPPPATATAASAATQRRPSAVRPRTPLQPAQSEFSSNVRVVEVGRLSPKSLGGNSMQTGGLATTDTEFAGRRPRSRSRNNTRATHDASYLATRRSGDALTSTRDPPRPSYPSHPEAKYDGAPPRDAQRSSYNSNQAKYDAASPSVSGRGRTQNLPTRSQRPSKTNSRPPSRGSHESDESRHDYYQPSARPRRGDPNIISVEVDEEHEEYDDRRSRLPRARHDEGTERVTMRTHTRTSGGQQQPSRSNDSREAVVGDDDPDPYYVTRSSGRSNLPGRSPRDSRKPSSRKSQWDKY